MRSGNARETSLPKPTFPCLAIFLAYQIEHFGSAYSPETQGLSVKIALITGLTFFSETGSPPVLARYEIFSQGQISRKTLSTVLHCEWRRGSAQGEAKLLGKMAVQHSAR